MAQRLKRWESPRRQGRNDKGKGGSARQRQRRKQFQALRQKLKDQPPNHNNQQTPPGGGSPLPPFFLAMASGQLDRGFPSSWASRSVKQISVIE